MLPHGSPVHEYCPVRRNWPGSASQVVAWAAWGTPIPSHCFWQRRRDEHKPGKKGIWDLEFVKKAGNDFCFPPPFSSYQEPGDRSPQGAPPAATYVCFVSTNARHTQVAIARRGAAYSAWAHAYGDRRYCKRRAKASRIWHRDAGEWLKVR